MTDALTWLKQAFHDEPDEDLDPYSWENFDLANDYLSPGNGEIGAVHTTPNGEHTFEVMDQYWRRIEEEEVWIVLRDVATDILYKVSGEFTSWDSVDWTVAPTESTTKTITVWS